MQTLLSRIGAGEPFLPNPAGGSELLGPTLRVLAEKSFARVALFPRPGFTPAAEQLTEEICRRHPHIDVQMVTEFCGDILLAWRLPASEVAKALEAGMSVLELELPPVPGDPIRLSTFASTRTGVPMAVREPTAAYAIRNPKPSRPVLEEQREACGLVGSHPVFLEAVNRSEVVAQHQVPVLLQGETGTGKELFARLIHQLSPRADEPFVAVNCGALPERLVESTLFGHRKGAFTGADSNQHGKFALAHGGSLFLDEIGELPLEHQPKLLRVLQERKIQAVGASEEEDVDVRVIAATHRHLDKLVPAGLFREDLYFRLAVGVIALPPLRERRSDISELALHMLDEMNRTFAEPKQFTSAALRRLEAQNWLGNVRDLQNVVRRSMLWCDKKRIGKDDLQFDTLSNHPVENPDLPSLGEGFSLDSYLRNTRNTLIESALQQTDGNQSAAARILGCSAQSIQKFVREQRRDG